MNNGDMPAMPNTEAVGDALLTTGGLTKREHIAAMAMQGILSNAHFAEHGDNRPEILAASAVAQADGLLRVLGITQDSNPSHE
jgi:hypothetical protein